MRHFLEVSRSGYYESVGGPPSARAIRWMRIPNSARQVHAESHSIYGSQKITAVLDAQDDLEQACPNTVQRAMQELRLQSCASQKFTPTITKADLMK